MKLTVVLFSVVVCLVNWSEAAVWRGVANDIDHPGKCVINKTVFIEYGSEYHPPDRCEKIKCFQSEEGGGEVLGYSCGVKIVDGCKDAGYVDVSQNYPDCCLRKFICKENGQEKIVEM